MCIVRRFNGLIIEINSRGDANQDQVEIYVNVKVELLLGALHKERICICHPKQGRISYVKNENHAK